MHMYWLSDAQQGLRLAHTRVTIVPLTLQRGAACSTIVLIVAILTLRRLEARPATLDSGDSDATMQSDDEENPRESKNTITFLFKQSQDKLTPYLV